MNLVGLFEPVETDEGFRRRGLARAVMTEGLHRMRAAGMRTARVEHDITNAAAAALYESLGFSGRVRDRRLPSDVTANLSTLTGPRHARLRGRSGTRSSLVR